MTAATEELAGRVARAALGGEERARQRERRKGKLLVRERLACLLDAGSPFLELSPLAANGMHEEQVPAAGILTGGQSSSCLLPLPFL